MLLNNEIGAMKRSDIYEMIKSELTTGRKLNQAQVFFDIDKIESVMKYFMPSIPKKAKTSEQWCCKAVAKKDVRYYITQVYSDGHRLAGTDGHRIHYVPTTLEEGFYCPKSMIKTDMDAKFPDIDRIIDCKRPELTELDVTKAPTKLTSENIEVIQIADKVWLQKQWLLEALNGETLVTLRHGLEWHTNVAGETSRGQFIIMPINIG